MVEESILGRNEVVFPEAARSNDEAVSALLR
jgi:hypothetical protein